MIYDDIYLISSYFSVLGILVFLWTRSARSTRYVSVKKAKIKSEEEAEDSEADKNCIRGIIDDPENNSSTNKMLKTPLKINIDGHFGSSSSNIYRAENAVLVRIGIGVTPLSFDPPGDPADEEHLPRLQPHLEQRDGASDVQPEEGRPRPSPFPFPLRVFGKMIVR